MKTIETYIEKHSNYSEALIRLRTILNSTELEETIKWGAPTYTISGKNVLGLGAFKSYVGIWFFNGALLKDESKVLVNAQEGKTKAMRQLRFNSVKDIDKDLVLRYVNEAIANQKQNKVIKPERSKETLIPPELQNVLEKNSKLLETFNTLSPYKQREYCEYIATAKREATKVNRLEKITPMILQGVGLHDKYRNC